jgi:hypothetical protein
VAYYTIRVYGLNGNRRVGVAVAGLGTARLKNPASENKETNAESWRQFGNEAEQS